MPHMLVHHRVEDFKKWKLIFDAAETFRKTSGEKSCHIFRNTEDPDDLTILFEWDNIEKAIKYSQSEMLKEAMKSSGVIGEPVVFLPDVVRE